MRLAIWMITRNFGISLVNNIERVRSECGNVELSLQCDEVLDFEADFIGYFRSLCEVVAHLRREYHSENPARNRILA